MSTQLPDELLFSIDTIKEKTVILYGPSKTGKSKLIQELLYHLHKQMPQIIVVNHGSRQPHIFLGHGTIAAYTLQINRGVVGKYI